MHLRFDCLWAPYSGVTQGHPQAVMKELGITYQHATPQSIADQWWFWNCENIPDELPQFLEEMNNDPMTCIGFGLSEETAEKIRDYQAV
ncbi:MAG: hypothetical protein OEM38_04065 [Gammaproteobacteria bacterium]|nr:hypothetical protein [Gammaproteobacteria bacterium]